MRGNKETKNLILVLVSASKVMSKTEDIFFKKKIFHRLVNFTEEYVDFKSKGSVAQYREGFLKLKSECDNLLETVDFVIYSNPVDNTPLLYLKRRILLFKLAMIKNINKRVRENNMIKIDYPVQKDIVLDQAQEPASNKDKILSLIKRRNKIRAKDIIGEFNDISDRTVKRTLKDLADNGLIRKEEINKAVYYSIL